MTPREQAEQIRADVATARLMVSLLSACREKGLFFALHPAQLDDSIAALSAVLLQVDQRLSALIDNNGG